MTTDVGSKPIPTSKAEIRRRTALLTVFVGCVEIIAALYYGNDLLYSVSFGLINASCGLATWWAYHLVSRRNDGVAFIWASASAVLIFLDHKLTAKTLWSVASNYIVFIIPLIALFSVGARGPATEMPGAEPARLLNDHEIDSPGAQSP